MYKIILRFKLLKVTKQTFSEFIFIKCTYKLIELDKISAIRNQL